MSGTSLDGVSAAVVRFTTRDDGHIEPQLLAFIGTHYSREQRQRLHDALERGTAREYCRLAFDLGTWLADAALAVLAEAGVPRDEVRAIGSHGQTVWHEAPHSTWQIGEAAVIAERTGIDVVSDFRVRDVAAGGQGAPLVPMADALLFGADHPRVLLNLGGMANFTYVPRRGADDGVFACDTGPGVAVMDAVTRLVDPRRGFDRDGHIAAQGTPDEALLAELLGDPYFAAPPPKSTGRELFGTEYAARLHARVPGADGVATAVELTARTVADAIARWTPAAAEVIASGGGCHHPGLMAAIERELGRRRGATVAVRRFDEVFFPGDAKEAVAFALLGYLTLHGQPGNVPAATGARGSRVLGSLTPA
jgi:anhydro-N-acetylmuramic acid kinase